MSLQRKFIEALVARVQKTCLPGIWSKGIALSRDRAVTFDAPMAGDDAIIARVHRPDRPVAAKVSLWPAEETEESDWFCDCGDRAEVCAHTAAAAIALKSRGEVSPEGASGGETQEAHPAPSAVTPLARASARLLYFFTRDEGHRLGLERRLRFPDREERLTSSLVSFVGGISSGRIAAPAVAATREDFAIDGILADGSRTELTPSVLSRLLPALAGTSGVLLDGKPVRTSSRRVRASVCVSEHDGGFQVHAAREIAPEVRGGIATEVRGGIATEVREWFTNGAWLVGDLLSAAEDVVFTAEERRILTANGLHFRTPEEIAYLVTNLLPALESKVDLEITTTRLPRTVHVPPRAALHFEKKDDGSLLVLPRILYGDPPLVEITPRGAEVLFAATEVAVRDLSAEAQLERKLTTELHLRIGQWSRFSGIDALDFMARARGWDAGTAGRRFAPKIEIQSDGLFELRFEVVDRAESDRVLAGWDASLRERVEALLAARDQSLERRLPRSLIPEAAEIGSALGATLPDSVRELRQRLRASGQAIPEAPLPPDLRAELRSYQRAGINWLSLLRDSGLGAMLADDMGLGKTLQALCAVRGRTLVVCPSSVLHSWRDQAARFRPSLKTSLFHGTGRRLDPSVDLTITSYAVLRLDRERLAAENWDSVILDEAQTIRNADSQTATAAHALTRASFRLTLSGTPIENRPEDLWSQFQFLNPGLLGRREEFRNHAETTAGRERLRKRVKPFILRRLKREVAPELPPRTEVVLECELSSEERATYDAVLISSRSEALAKLESEPSGRGVLAALEALLRLRQACCDLALVPGSPPSEKPSSKVTLLLEQLSESIAEGHRSLVFSQWTSFLDRIETSLTSEGITYLRLDGSTPAPRRAEIVREFQLESGPAVLLISLKAGGVGLTLTAADHIFLMDPWWNPAVEDQAADRAHRIGQENPVLIHRLVASDTVEQRILALQQRKRELAGSLLDGGLAIESLTRQDLIELLN